MNINMQPKFGELKIGWETVEKFAPERKSEIKELIPVYQEAIDVLDKQGIDLFIAFEDFDPEKSEGIDTENSYNLHLGRSYSNTSDDRNLFEKAVSLIPFVNITKTTTIGLSSSSTTPIVKDNFDFRHILERALVNGTGANSIGFDYQPEWFKRDKKNLENRDKFLQLIQKINPDFQSPFIGDKANYARVEADLDQSPYKTQTDEA